VKRHAERGDGQPAGRAAADRRPASPDPRALVLRLQRAAGNRAVNLLQRREKAWVRTHSIGEATVEDWSADERRAQVGVLVANLEEAGVDATDRETMELNLETLEAWGAAHGVEFTGAEGFRLREVARTAAVDVKALAAAAKEMLPDEFAFPAARFRPNVEWAVDQLAWATDRIVDAVGQTQTGDPAKLKWAGHLLTLAISVIKAMAAYLGYVQVAIVVETEAPHSWGDEMATKIEAFSDETAPWIWKIRYLDPKTADQAAAELLQVVPTWRFDFSQFVDRYQERLEDRAHFLKIVSIIQLAWLAFDIWMLPVAGVPGGGGAPPRISGPPGGAVALSGGGVLISAESIEAVRELIRAGVLSNPQLIKLVGGGAPKPLQASTPKGPGAKPAAGGGRAARPAPSVRPQKGLPTLEEDAVVKEYTRELADFRTARRALEDAKAAHPRDTEAIKAAAKAEDAVRRRLDAIEARAAADKGELAEHLDPLVRERDILKTTGMKGTPTGTRVDCEAVRKLPSDLRYADFADLEATLGKPTRVDAAAKPAGAGMPEGHQRITWAFKDKSKIVIDVPRRLGGRAASADLPHVEFHGPKGERLDPQGLQVPERSIGSHITITDSGNLLETTFLGPSRGGR
jgi:hypothetical protein